MTPRQVSDLAGRALDVRRQGQRAHAARRVVLPGYPKEEPFTTSEEVWEYLRVDRIVCLRCGKSYKSLAGHLRHIHGWAPDEYRTFYGLPKSGGRKGLLCADTFDSYSRRAKEMVATHRDAILDRLARYKTAANEACSRHVKPPYVVPGENLGEHYTPVSPEAWNEFLCRVAAGRHPGDVCTDADMPTHFYEHIAEDESFAEELARLCEALPFTVQAKHHTLGARFGRAVADLLATGMTQKQAAQELEVQQMTVSRHARRLQTQAQEGTG